MRVFHFSDIHWSDKNAGDIKIVIDACVADLETFSSETNIENAILLFTGDLVQAGERSADFQLAYDKTIGRIASTLKIPKERVLICPGNHDMSRVSARSAKMLERSAKLSLVTRPEISAFVSNVDGDIEKEVLLDRAANFYHWHDKFFESGNTQR